MYSKQFILEPDCCVLPSVYFRNTQNRSVVSELFPVLIFRCDLHLGKPILASKCRNFLKVSNYQKSIWRSILSLKCEFPRIQIRNQSHNLWKITGSFRLTSAQVFQNGGSRNLFQCGKKHPALPDIVQFVPVPICQSALSGSRIAEQPIL